jgi:hypothetical protein
VAIEEKKLANPNLDATRAQYTKVPIWPYLAVGGAGVVGIGMIVYALRSRHG